MDTAEGSHFPIQASISSHYKRCMHSFANLLRCGKLDSSILPSVQDDLGRFRVWAANTGAHRIGRVSLDYRLREASHIYAQVAKLLGELYNDLEEGLCGPFQDELVLDLLVHELTKQGSYWYHSK